MNIGALFEALNKQDIPFVLIGGTALIFYGSKRAALDTDIAVKTLDLEPVVKTAYALDLRAVVGVDWDRRPQSAGSVEEALLFLEKSDWGFIKFLSSKLDINFFYDIPVPFMRLYKESENRRAMGVPVKVANLHHLKMIKERSRETGGDPDKRKMDQIDLDFIAMKLRR